MAFPLRRTGAVFRALLRCGAGRRQASGNKTGPNLSGIVGRTAGSVPGFNYSTANKGSGTTPVCWRRMAKHIMVVTLHPCRRHDDALTLDGGCTSLVIIIAAPLVLPRRW